MLLYIDTILLILVLLEVKKTARPSGRTVFLNWRRKVIFILKRTLTYTWSLYTCSDIIMVDFSIFADNWLQSTEESCQCEIQLRSMGWE